MRHEVDQETNGLAQEWVTADFISKLVQENAEVIDLLERKGVDVVQYRREALDRMATRGLMDDIIFGTVMCRNRHFASSLVGSILGIDFGECEVARQHWEFPGLTTVASTRFDVLVRSKNSLVVVMEMENRTGHATVERALTYLGTVLHSHVTQEAGGRSRGSMWENPVKVAAVFLVDGDPFGRGDARYQFDFVDMKTLTPAADVVFRAVFIDVAGDLRQLENEELQEMLSNFRVQDDSRIGRMIRQMIIDAQRSRVVEMETFVRCSYSDLYEEAEAEKAAREAAEAEAEAEKAAREAAEAEAKSEKAAREAAEAEVRAAEAKGAQMMQLLPVLWGIPGGDKMLDRASKDDKYRAELMKQYFTRE